jgi:hypothetical protein
MIRLFLALTFVSLASTASAQRDVSPKEGPSNFDRTHRTIDKHMNTGNDRSPPLGEGRGERTGIGGGDGGGAGRGTENHKEIGKRNQ